MPGQIKVAPTIGVDGLPLQFGEEPIPFTCPFCGAYVLTAVHYKPGGKSFGVCCIISLFILPNIFCLEFLPMCIPSCMDVEHACPNCSRIIGYSRRKWSKNAKGSNLG